MFTNLEQWVSLLVLALLVMAFLSAGRLVFQSIEWAVQRPLASKVALGVSGFAVLVWAAIPGNTESMELIGLSCLRFAVSAAHTFSGLVVRALPFLVKS